MFKLRGVFFQIWFQQLHPDITCVILQEDLREPLLEYWSQLLAWVCFSAMGFFFSECWLHKMVNKSPTTVDAKSECWVLWCTFIELLPMWNLQKKSRPGMQDSWMQELSNQVGGCQNCKWVAWGHPLRNTWFFFSLDIQYTVLADANYCFAIWTLLVQSWGLGLFSLVVLIRDWQQLPRFHMGHGGAVFPALPRNRMWDLLPTKEELYHWATVPYPYMGLFRSRHHRVQWDVLSIMCV